MPRQGEVRVRLCGRLCVAVERFMIDLAAREETPSWLVSESEINSNRLKATRLGTVMRKAALRKRTGTGFVLNIDRELAAFFAGRYLPLCRDYRALWRAQKEFRRVASVKPGRQRLVGNRLTQRLASKHIDRRHRFRLRARSRLDAAFKAYFEYLEAHGETALTSSKPFSDFLT